MRITIQVTCDSPEDAMNAMARLTAPSVAITERMPFKGSTEAELDGYLSSGKKSIVNRVVDSEVSGSEIKTGELGKKVDNDVQEPSHPTTRPNINPGTPLIGKIGTATTDVILSDLAAGRQPPQPKYTEHLKLLWSRGMINFDGKEYYL